MRLNKAFHISTVLLGLFPILKLNHFSILMMIWFVLAIILAITNKTIKLNKQYVGTFLVLSFAALMYWIYLPFVTDFKELSKQIVKSLPFIVFPLGFIWNRKKITLKIVQNIFTVFSFATIILNVIGWFEVFKNGFMKTWQENDFYNPTFRSFFSNATSLHIPYLGLFSSFTVIYLLYLQLQQKKFKALNSLMILLLLASMYIYSARMALGCVIISCIFLLWNSINDKKIKFASVFLIPILTFALFWFSPLKERYVTVLETDLILPHKEQMPHEVNYRYGIWYCATEIIQDNLFFGVNPDQAQYKLNSCYNQFDYESYEDFTKVTYNSHNQYLDQMIKFGVIGCVIFIICLVYYIPKSSVLYQAFSIIIGISFLTENYLDRQMGVVFIALFNTLFVVYKLSEREKSFSS
ncbi:O-antigen ligase family protein [Flavobacterium sp. xlx-214]|uniref:O-antigen ligase family protein n=1 Tax=unclassified Flavobacterium TaxID=196869 RepID=UPI0013D0EA99|nr:MULTISPECIES: O-antigen ligase family protein [unclassified Flavobacterium]MBA5792150.1 O-antigen ligase family protein [Flavobacterium sp. xlx-221]QMI84396.1 O-antigen ligase family protein [Flavobacterium sp. xlx-214]